jgi:beta-glucosidase
MDDIKKLITELTLEEKAALCSGADFWNTKDISRLNIPNVMVSDGPHGLRKQDEEGDHIGIGDSVKAVCFPAASALACSFDTDLLHTIGEALGDECQAEKVSTLLGPAVNMKRSPLCGRNFEYFSEDPYLAGNLAANIVNGIQSKGIGTSVKHFAVNNQEYRRMSVSAEVDERTLREIYLAAFETIVKKAQPTTIMCSYNRINGTYACENDWLLNKVLREEWGFNGLVMTDWGAMNDRVKALKAGLDLEMPASGGVRDAEIVEAVKNGTLELEVLDQAVERVLTLVKHYYDHKVEGAAYDKEEHHKLAKMASLESSVLLKNENILPLKRDTKVAFIGKFAQSPRYQGGGSSHINSFKVSNALEAVKQYGEVTYAQGYDTKSDSIDAKLLAEAIEAAKDAHVAVIFAGLPDSFESEGYDRKHLNLPNVQNHLIEEIAKVQENIVVVLHNGSPVLLPWRDKVKAILSVYLGGQAVGEATVDLLYGVVNPSGKLAETYPLRLQDNPSYLNFPGVNNKVHYTEGLFIGYRYYDSKEMDVLYPFGYGLSYTTFEYSDLSIDAEGTVKDADIITVSVKVTNTGTVSGKEIVQLYISEKESGILRPTKELKGFAKVALNPGEEKEVTFTLDKRSFAYYNTELGDWHVNTGTYEILIGKSSRDIVLSGDIIIESTVKLPFVASDITTFGDVVKYANNPAILQPLLQSSMFSQMNDMPDDEMLGEGTAEMWKEMFNGLPLHSMLSFGASGITTKDIQAIIDEINNNSK